MGKKEKRKFEKKIKVKEDKKKREGELEYLKRIMGENETKKPLEPVDPIHLKNNGTIITHEDQGRY